MLSKIPSRLLAGSEGSMFLSGFRLAEILSNNLGQVFNSFALIVPPD
jgi:hypothetical protein